MIKSTRVDEINNNHEQTHTHSDSVEPMAAVVITSISGTDDELWCTVHTRHTEQTVAPR